MLGGRWARSLALRMFSMSESALDVQLVEQWVLLELMSVAESECRGHMLVQMWEEMQDRRSERMLGGLLARSWGLLEAMLVHKLEMLAPQMVHSSALQMALSLAETVESLSVARSATSGAKSVLELAMLEVLSVRWLALQMARVWEPKLGQLLAQP